MGMRSDVSSVKEENYDSRRQIFPSAKDTELHPLVNQQRARDILNLLIVVRLLNALFLKTFFQPDEYFQSLEPAWQMAFGAESGAWITWEWEHQLRSSLHPAIFAAFYYIASKPMELFGIIPQFRAMVLAVLPNVGQAFIAAGGDYYTWKLAEKIYGSGSNAGWVTLLMTIFSPWQWFVSTRTFSNCLETTLTITALYFWPWEMTLDSMPSISPGKTMSQTAEPSQRASLPSIFSSPRALNHLRVSLLLAILACVLRPTNIFIWFCVLTPTFANVFFSKPRVPFADNVIFLREGIFCGIVVLLFSGISDYLYFGALTFPPYQWLTFNVTLDLAVFYGRNDWHYYLSQGLPLLTTTYLPFTLLGLYRATSGTPIQLLLAIIIFHTIATLSLIAHKEVRFIYPLLPLLHILTAPPLVSYFYTTTTKITHPPPFPSTPVTSKITVLHRKPLLFTILLSNIGLSYYVSRVHQSGPIPLMTFLRHEYESLALDASGVPLSSSFSSSKGYQNPYILPYDPGETFVAFLTPCHSTPWRSQLFYPGLKAWALTCEPPVTIPLSLRDTYVDEADRFYADPVGFLKAEVGGRNRPWPRYVVGFEGVETAIQDYYAIVGKGMVMKERWRTSNGHWNDDDRRRGDLVVWEFGVPLVRLEEL